MEKSPPEGIQSAFESETAKIREILARGRSANQLALFDLLVERSRDRRSPKEVEIAVALFGTGTSFDGDSDSGVRVYVHRLRKRIDEHYQAKTGPRLVIPKGEYRIVLETNSAQEQQPELTSKLRHMIARNPALSLGLLLIACAILVFASWRSQYSESIHGIDVAVDRQTLLGGSAVQFLPLIAIGDSMLLAETKDRRSIQRMVLNPSVRTRDDFSSYLKDHPGTFYQLYDFNLHFAPIGAVEAAWKVQDGLGSLGRRSADVTQIVPVSALSPEQFKSRDIIFVGRLSQLGKLEPQVFAESRYQLQAYNRLVDKKSGAAFQGDVYTGEPSAAATDYGYISVRASATGRRLVVLSGLGDDGIANAVALLDSPREIAHLKRKTGTARHFEALIEVRTRSGLSTQRKLVAAHALP